MNMSQERTISHIQATQFVEKAEKIRQEGVTTLMIPSPSMRMQEAAHGAFSSNTTAELMGGLLTLFAVRGGKRRSPAVEGPEYTKTSLSVFDAIAQFPQVLFVIESAAEIEHESMIAMLSHIHHRKLQQTGSGIEILVRSGTELSVFAPAWLNAVASAQV